MSLSSHRPPPGTSTRTPWSGTYPGRPFLTSNREPIEWLGQLADPLLAQSATTDSSPAPTNSSPKASPTGAAKSQPSGRRERRLDAHPAMAHHRRAATRTPRNRSLPRGETPVPSTWRATPTRSLPRGRTQSHPRGERHHQQPLSALRPAPSTSPRGPHCGTGREAYLAPRSGTSGSLGERWKSHRSRGFPTNLVSGKLSVVRP
jgi:hypothetical protein